MIAVVTDSTAQLPADLVDRYGITVVPITITVDGVDHAEGVDLDADAFYALFEGGAPPTITTSQPSPGLFADTYSSLAARGATEILSVHVGADFSGTLNAARLGAKDAPVPVTLVDTGTASFGVGCCAWEAAEAVGAGATADDAATVARAVADRVGTVFIVQALDLVRAGGRLTDAVDGVVDGIPVLTMDGSDITTIGTVHTADEASDLMAAEVLSGGEDLRVAIGIADRAAEPFWTGLERRLDGRPEVREIVRYRVGPSVGVHAGPGTAGAFWYPAR